jgi:hypothetical protein
MESSASKSIASIGSVPGKESLAVMRVFKVTSPEGPPPMTATRMLCNVSRTRAYDLVEAETINKKRQLMDDRDSESKIECCTESVRT